MQGILSQLFGAEDATEDMTLAAKALRKNALGAAAPSITTVIKRFNNAYCRYAKNKSSAGNSKKGARTKAKGKTGQWEKHT